MKWGGPQAEFIGPEGARVLTVLYTPERAESRGCVLVVPPFAEEMNKSRRMSVELAGSLAKEGFAVVLVDLYGTGDSDGDFAEATWPRWISDVLLTADWCRQRGHPVSGMIGIRLGCGLAIEAALKLDRPLRRMVFWQPSLDGARAFEQFLRLRVAASMFDPERKETVKDLRGRLAAGETLEVAGYEVSNELATGICAMSASKLAAPTAQFIEWIEVARESKPPPEPTVRALESIQSAGAKARYHQVIGEPFWTSTEIVVSPDLIAKTTELFCEAG